MRGVQGDSARRGVHPDAGNRNPTSRTSSSETLSERPLAPLVPDELAVWAEWQCDADPTPFNGNHLQDGQNLLSGEGVQHKANNSGSNKPLCERNDVGWESRRSLCSLGRRSCDSVLPRVHCHRSKNNQSKTDLTPNIIVKPYTEPNNKSKGESRPLDLFYIEGEQIHPKQKLAVVRPRTRPGDTTASSKWKSEEGLARSRRKVKSELSSPVLNHEDFNSPSTRWRSEDILPSRNKRANVLITPHSHREVIAELSDGDQTVSLRLVEAEPFSEASTIPIGQYESPSPSAEEAVADADGGGGGGKRGERFEGTTRQQHFLHANTCAFTAAVKDTQVVNGKKMIGQDYLSPTWSVRPMLNKSDTPLLPQDSMEVEAGCLALSRRCWRCCRAKADYCHGLCLNCPGFWSILFLLIDIPCAFCFC